MRTEKEWQDAARVADSNFDKIGDMSFVDKNGDGKISFGEDRQIVGDPNPDFIFGWTNNFSYKNFDLSIYINGSVGNDIYNVLRAETNIVSTWGNQRAEVMDRWTANNPNGKYPRAHVLVNQNLLQSDYPDRRRIIPARTKRDVRLYIPESLIPSDHCVFMPLHRTC